MASSATYVGTPKAGVAQIANADASTLKTLVTAGASGSKVAGVNVASTDTSSRIIQLWLTRSSTDYLLGSFTVGAGAGNDGTTLPVNMLAAIPGLPVDNDGNPFLFLESGDTLRVSSTTTVTSGKIVHALATVGNF